MNSYPQGHPLATAPKDIVGAVLIAESLGPIVADMVLKARLGILAENGDKKARALLDIAAYLTEQRATKRIGGQGEVMPQMMKDPGPFGILPETMNEATDRIIRIAIQLRELNKKMVDTIFGVGLLRKPARDAIVSRLAA